MTTFEEDAGRLRALIPKRLPDDDAGDIIDGFNFMRLRYFPDLHALLKPGFTLKLRYVGDASSFLCTTTVSYVSICWRLALASLRITFNVMRRDDRLGC